MKAMSQLIDELRRHARERDIAAKMRPFELSLEQRAKFGSLYTMPASTLARTLEIKSQ